MAVCHSSASGARHALSKVHVSPASVAVLYNTRYVPNCWRKPQGLWTKRGEIRQTGAVRFEMTVTFNRRVTLCMIITVIRGKEISKQSETENCKGTHNQRG